jgi:S-adenosylmethionine-diacylglycerol 3-amino-3-carboxypropyl transferase
MKNMYIYNYAWEDHYVDLQSLKFKQDDVVIGITTGGCGMLNYLTTDVKEVHSCDINIYQNYLLELKMAMMKVFTQKKYFLVINASKRHPLFLENLDKIKGHMTKDAAEWLSSNLGIMDGFIYSGTCGKLFKLNNFICRLSGLINIVKCNTIEEQIQFFEKYKWKLRILDKLIWNKTTIKYLSPLCGVPKSQICLMKNEKNYLYNVMNYLSRNLLFKHNHFFGLWLGVQMSNECCPFYLHKENYELVKKRLHRIKIHKSFIHEIIPHLKNKPTVGVLLDHMDWMSVSEVKKEWQVYQKYCPKTKFLWRSASRTQYIPCLDRLNYEIKYELDYNKCEYGDGDNLKDKIGMYPSTYVASFPKDRKMIFDNIKEVKYNISLYDKLMILIKMWSSPFINKFTPNHQEFLNNFYKNQSEHYDAYRQDMLHGKNPMMESVPLCKGDSLLILGAGTCDILEHIDVKKLNKVTAVDLCKPLLDIAKKELQSTDGQMLKHS